MKRSDLIDAIAKDNPQLSARDAEAIVVMFFDEITRSLSAFGRVELRGFGSFAVRKRNPRQARNPKTGATVEVSQKCVPFFKAGRILRDRLN